MANYNLPADYKYFCIPKINKDAFLIANISAHKIKMYGDNGTP